MTPARNNFSGPTQPWWRIGMMWLALGGPAVVAMASIFSAVLAIRGADVPVQVTGANQSAAQRPAVQARNHAATPAR
jgi:uncharacterized protein